MKRVMSIMITLLFSFTLIFSAIAAEDTNNNARHMPRDGHHHWPPGDSGFGESGHHSGNFKIADLLDDEDPEILLLKDGTLTFMDNKGEVLFTKTVEGIEDHHGEWWFMPGHGHGNGEVGLEIADLDGDGISEIIILDTEKLIILDNNGDPKGAPITLP